jgi:Nitrile hydratase, alpha chain
MPGEANSACESGPGRLDDLRSCPVPVPQGRSELTPARQVPDARGCLAPGMGVCMPGDFEQRWTQLMARAWADPAFKAKLLADPASVLKESGLQVPAGITIKVVENTDKVVHLTLPLPPAPEELSEEELHQAAGGGGYRCWWNCYRCWHHCERCWRC